MSGIESSIEDIRESSNRGGRAAQVEGRVSCLVCVRVKCLPAIIGRAGIRALERVEESGAKGGGREAQLAVRVCCPGEDIVLFCLRLLRLLIGASQFIFMIVR